MCQQSMVLILFFIQLFAIGGLNGAALISEKMFYGSVKYEQGKGVKFYGVSQPTSVNEQEPKDEDYSDSECESTVKRNVNNTRFPQIIYHVQCKSVSEQSCRQATKVVHILRRNGACTNTGACEYESDVMNVQTVCLKIQKKNQPNVSKDLQVILNQGIHMQTEDLEPLEPMDVNWVSKCPWDWVAHLDENRFPRVFQRAVCRNTNSECKTIYKDIVMFRKVSHDCIGLFCGYERYISREPVACVSTKSK